MKRCCGPGLALLLSLAAADGRTQTTTGSPDAAGTGPRISMNLEDVPVRTVLQMLAQAQGRQLVLAPDVTGATTLSFDDLAVDQAWQAVLDSQGLRARRRGDVWRIAPEPDTPRDTGHRVVSLAHMAPATLLELLQRDILLGDGTEVAADPTGHRLLLFGPAPRLEELVALIRRLDQPRPQVMLEGRVVLAQRSTLDALGVDWRAGPAAGGGATTDRTVWADFYRAARGGGSPAIDRAAALQPNLSVPLGVQQDGAPGFGFGVIHNGSEVGLMLSALESNGQVDIVAQPRLLTTAGHTATIASGTTIPYPGAEGATEFVDAVLSVEATPRLAGAGQIGMVLSVRQDSPTGTGSDNISTNSLTTRVRVDAGETLVLGGLFRQEQSEETRSVPVLGRLPWVGRLFRHTRTRSINNELVIMITPTIIE